MDDVELEKLLSPLLKLIRKEKHHKAATRLVAWLNSAGYQGADELVQPLLGGLATLCVEYDIPGSFLDNRPPQVTGVAMNYLVKATVLAQQILASAVERVKLGRAPGLTEQEHELMWASDETSFLCMYYWLQCLAASWKVDGLPRVVAALYAPEPIEDSVQDSIGE